MLIVRSLFNQVVIPDIETYAIYSIDYYLDKDMKPCTTETPSNQTYEYGDIVIQTTKVKYTFKQIYSAYDYVAKLLDYIEKHKDEHVIYINLGDLNEILDDPSPIFEIENL